MKWAKSRLATTKFSWFCRDANYLSYENVQYKVYLVPHIFSLQYRIMFCNTCDKNIAVFANGIRSDKRLDKDSNANVTEKAAFVDG